MGRWEQLKALIKGEKKVAVEGVRYILKRKTDKGGMTKAMELATPITLEDIYPHLEAGVYALHKYQKGQTGFTVVWGPVEVIGQAASLKGKAPARGKVLTAADKLKEALAPLEEMKQLSTYYEEHFGMGAFIKAMDKGREQYASLKGIYGEKTSSDDTVKYDGSLPIWMHPKGIPALIGNSLDQVEKRIEKWGLIPGEGSSRTTEKSLMDMPSKPNITMNPAEKPAVDIVEEKVGSEEGEKKDESEEGDKGSE